MAVEIKVPALGESVTEATVAKWLVKVGDTVAIDQPLCELETDKVTVEVNASVAGSVIDFAVEEGATVQVGGVLCHLESGAGSAAKPAAAIGSRRTPRWASRESSTTTDTVSAEPSRTPPLAKTATRPPDNAG